MPALTQRTARRLPPEPLQTAAANFILQDGAPVRDRIVEILELINLELDGK
jgi:hypothetical protein